jgi:hypothetical protein
LWQVEVGGLFQRIDIVGIQRVGDGERCIVGIGGIQHVGDVGETVLENAHFSGQRLHPRFVPLDASLLFAEVRSHCRHWTDFLVDEHVGALFAEGTADDGTLARYDAHSEQDVTRLEQELRWCSCTGG